MNRLLLIGFLLTSLPSVSQYQWDYGTKFGAANYLGDIGGRELTTRDFVLDMHMESTRWAMGT
ncbi:MAG: hypothetical protein ACK54P_13690, partial [Bacteroidota bacterium]